MKTSSDEDKKMWGDVLVMDLMSTKESAVDDETGEEVLKNVKVRKVLKHFGKLKSELLDVNLNVLNLRTKTYHSGVLIRYEIIIE